MSRARNVVLALTVLIALAAVASVAVAQPPEETPAQKRRAVAAERALPAAAKLAIARAVPPRSHPLLGHPEVDVRFEEMDNGLTILVTSNNPELVKQIQTDLAERLEWLKEMPKEAAQAPLPGTPEQGPPGLLRRPMQRLLEGAAIKTELRDDGLAIIVTSDKPEQAKAIKNVLPKRIEAMRHFAAGARALKESVAALPGAMRARDFLHLLLAKDVSITVADTEKGVSVEFTSNDPEKVQKLRELIRDRMEALEELRQRLPEGPPTEVHVKEISVPARAKTRLAAPEHPEIREVIRQELSPHLVVRKVQPAEETELREIIRDEIRRYLQEELEKHPE